MIRLTDQQWADIVQILDSYRADLQHIDDVNPEYIQFIDEIIEEIGDNQNGTEIAFEIEESFIDLSEPDDD